MVAKLDVWKLNLPKKIYLIRHAKSSWKDSSLADFDRPLNKRGKKNAPFMAKLLKQKKIYFELMLSSPAKRAEATVQAYEKEKMIGVLQFDKSIYDASFTTLLSLFHTIDECYSKVALVGHNPSLNMLCEYLCQCVMDNIPTAACVGLSFEGKWSELDKNGAVIDFFEYPKKYDS